MKHSIMEIVLVDQRRTDITKTDQNKDKVFDLTDTLLWDCDGGRVVSKYGTIINKLYPANNSISKIDYHYDAKGRQNYDQIWHDLDHNGTLESFSGLTRSYASATSGRITKEVLASPDFDGDGVAGDYTYTTKFTYNSVGNLTKKLTTTAHDGVVVPGEYVMENWTYRTDGKLTKYVIDDPVKYDCVISEARTYLPDGKLQNIQEQNIVRFGDKKYHITDSFTYKNGILDTKTVWGDVADNGKFYFRADTKFGFKSGYTSELTKFDVTGDGKPEAVKFIENWFNLDGNLTTTLISYDDDGKGGKLAGGYDRRDLIKQHFDDTGYMDSRTVDLGNDKIIDSLFTSHWDDILVA